MRSSRRCTRTQRASSSSRARTARTTSWCRGVRVLLDIIAELPADLAAAMFVVGHTPSDHPSTLPELLPLKSQPEHLVRCHFAEE